MWMYFLLLGVLVPYLLTSVTLVVSGLDSKPPLVDIKCSKCHTLKRVFIMCKTKDEWRDIIEKMMKKSPEWIQPNEAEQIFKEILALRPERVHAICNERKDYEDLRFLFVDRCTLCHNLNRVLLKDKTLEEWENTVERMRLEASDYISVEDAEKIISFLSERGETLKQDVGAQLLVTKCMTCHPGEQILLETHNHAEWNTIVRRCKEKSYQAFKTGWLNQHEVELIVDLLVKTQGTKPEKH